MPSAAISCRRSPLPRRMWAGSRFAFDGEPLAHRRDDQARLEDQVGRTQDRLDRLDGVRHRRAHRVRRARHLVRRGARHRLSRGGQARREAARAQARARPTPPGRRKIVADPVLLFRFSALTFNGHRIHYDQPYVTGTEGYPGLIVHGPLLGMLQIELARRSNPGEVRRRVSSSARCRRSLPAPPSRCGAPRSRRFGHDLDRQCQGRSCPAGKGHLPMNRYEIGVDSPRRF